MFSTGSIMGKTMTMDENLNSFSVRYKYHPSPFDEELLIHYLKKKVLQKTWLYNRMREVNLYYTPEQLIGEVNLYNYTAEQLFDKYQARGERVMYFITNQTYIRENRQNRLVAGGNGRWKVVGVDIKIGSMENPIGYKKSFVYHHQDGKKTSWIMQEYKVNQNTLPDKVINDLLLCIVYDKSEKNKMDSSVCSTRTCAFHDPIEKADKCHAATDYNLEPPQANQGNCFTVLGFLYQKLIVGTNYAILKKMF